MRFDCANEICSTNVWAELRAIAVRHDFDTARRQELSRIVELMGSNILKSWSEKYTSEHKASFFLNAAITFGLVSQCLRKLEILDDEEKIMSQIEIIFEEGERFDDI